MDTRVKPGMIAIIIASPMAPENIGRFVNVERAAVCGVDYHAAPAPTWVVSSEVPLIERFDNGLMRLTNQRLYRDSLLRPVTGLPVDEEITDEVTA